MYAFGFKFNFSGSGPKLLTKSAPAISWIDLGTISLAPTDILPSSDKSYNVVVITLNGFCLCKDCCAWTNLEPLSKKSSEFVAPFILRTSAKYLSKNTLGCLPIILPPTSSIAFINDFTASSPLCAGLSIWTNPAITPVNSGFETLSIPHRCPIPLIINGSLLSLGTSKLGIRLLNEFGSSPRTYCLIRFTPAFVRFNFGFKIPLKPKFLAGALLLLLIPRPESPPTCE